MKKRRDHEIERNKEMTGKRREGRVWVRKKQREKGRQKERKK